MNNQKFDTPFHINYIKGVSAAFDKAKEDPNFKLPAGEWWQKNQEVNFYHGFFSGISIALSGIESLATVEGATPITLHAELHSILGQLANIIVEKAPKIQVIDK